MMYLSSNKNNQVMKVGGEKSIVKKQCFYLSPIYLNHEHSIQTNYVSGRRIQL